MPTTAFVIGSLLTVSVVGYAGAATLLMFKKAAESSTSS